MQKTYLGKQLEVDENGHLVNPEDWSKEIASAIAKDMGIELTDKHWELIEYLRKEAENNESMSIRKVGKSGIVTIKEFYNLFPRGPLKNASKIAGLPKPESCL
ncbi:MAG: TusE/DsrC/DsvC family sulfur relay protein [Candidatus Spechtbacterales bacterium]|nr:TusE/DsrC/DsvC family sulfur relay protein [Candidatus Spechtbacterales bacterium]